MMSTLQALASSTSQVMQHKQGMLPCVRSKLPIHLLGSSTLLWKQGQGATHIFSQATVPLLPPESFRMFLRSLLFMIVLMSQIKGMSYSFYQGFLTRLWGNVSLVMEFKWQMIKNIKTHWWFCWGHSIGLGLVMSNFAAESVKQVNLHITSLGKQNAQRLYSIGTSWEQMRLP